MLKGSEKQVSWAKRIKAEKLGQWAKSDPEVFRQVEPMLNGEASAAWWITHREKSLTEVIPYIVDGGERETVARPKAAKSTPAAAANMTFSGLDDVHRFVGELRDSTTGELVVDTDCPF
jgi:hypothetical protein